MAKWYESYFGDYDDTLGVDDQIYGDYDKDSDLGLAQGMENAFAKTALETPEDEAPGWRDPVVFGARSMNLDRYMAHPTFHDNGFHPFRDNEAYYNDGRSTRLQNGRRTFNAYWDVFRAIVSRETEMHLCRSVYQHVHVLHETW